MKNVKITVLRKGFYPDLIREHLTEPPEECVCDFFREGDQFLYTGGAEMPAGFCPWAWIDLYRSVSALSCGASYTPWQSRDGFVRISGGRGSMWCAVPTGCAR
mgnify:CR=1 FL=1